MKEDAEGLHDVATNDPVVCHRSPEEDQVVEILGHASILRLMFDGCVASLRVSVKVDSKYIPHEITRLVHQ